MVVNRDIGLLGGLAAFLIGVGSGGGALAAPFDGDPHLTREHAQTGDATLALRVLSSRNDMVSGGDALVEVSGAAGPITATLNGANITTALRPAGQGALRGLITGLKLGENRLEVRQGGRRAALTVTNWPLSGPIFAGPKEAPFVCMTQNFNLPVTGGTLGPATDANCSAPTRVDYIYRTTGGAFRPWPKTPARPADLAQANVAGAAVPYIVRIETGVIDRSIYQTAMLHDPAGPPVDPTARPRGWNGRLVYQFGGGCTGGWYIQGRTTGGVLDDAMLSKGYAMASSSLNVYGNNCDDLLASEVMMMTKERVVERIGPPDFTIGWGCSGGAYQSLQTADNYPGLLDGIVVGCSYPDVAHGSISVHSFGARLLYRYFNKGGAQVPWTGPQMVAVSGLPDYAAIEAQGNRDDRINPRDVCNDGIPAPTRYDPAGNRAGVRCTVFDHAANGFGRDPATGFARRPLDNVGVQYGLKALNAGVISKAQFLDLNARVGGVDIDADYSPQRTAGDPVAIRRGYQSGRFLSGGGGLSATPIIDYRAYADWNEGDPHERFHSFSIRERLIKANGHADNQVMLVEGDRYGLFGLGSPQVRYALDQMDRWLTALKADRSAAPAAGKAVAAKPTGLVDSCFMATGQRITEPQVYTGDTLCNRLFPAHGNPYTVAGLPVANDVLKCALKPIDPADYTVAFTAEDMATLRASFPGGVCDTAKPGIGQQPLMGTWLSFGPR